jgi:hypothetical protein
MHGNQARSVTAAGCSAAKPLAVYLMLRRKVLLCSHSGASIGAALACCCAGFAVFHVVFAAFRCAGLTNFRAQSAYVTNVSIAARNGCCCQLAEISACHVGGNASCHGFWIFLFHASGGALQASNRALVACSDAISFFLANHFVSSKLPKIGQIHFEIDATEPL